MPIYVKEAEKEQENRAVKEFTDRVEPRKLFWKKFNNMKECIRDNETAPVQIITYYGVGGIGKSSLLAQIRKELSEEEPNAKYCYLDFEKVLKYQGDIVGILSTLKTEISKKYKYEFPLFELAIYEYNVKSGLNVSRKSLDSLLSRNSELNFLMTVVEEIPLVGTAAKILSLIDEGSTVLKNRLKDKELKSTLSKLDTMSLEELKNIIPYYFAKDLDDNIAKDKLPFVMELDTYEMLVNELSEVGYATKKDEWLKGEKGLIRNVNHVLWIIAGREKLKWLDENKEWEGTLDQHLLGDLSEADSTYFLTSTGITDPEIIHQMYKLSEGVPIFLDVCVDTYYKSLNYDGKVSTLDFLGDKNKLVERFFAYMNDQEKDFTTVLSFIGNFTDSDVEEKIKSILGNFSFSLYEKIKSFSFIIQEGENYKVHEAFRNIVIENAPEILKNKFNNSVKKEQEKEFEKIEKVETIEEFKKIEETTSENSETEEELEKRESIIYLEGLKREKYAQLLDSLVLDITQFLMQKPKYTKQTKKEYCDKVGNLIEKIDEYLEIYDVAYDANKLEAIIQNKLFKQTYEFKRLNGLYICLCIRSSMDRRSLGYGIFNGKKKTERLQLHLFHALDFYYRTRNLYKDKEEKRKQLYYIIRILESTRCTTDNNTLVDNGFLTTHKELKLILLRAFNRDSIESAIVHYAYRDIKTFNNIIETSTFSYYKNSNNLDKKRWYIRLLLLYLYEEFKGKPGKGRHFNSYRMTKEAMRSINNKSATLTRNEELQEEIREYILEEKKHFISYRMDTIIELIEKDKKLIESETLHLFIDVVDAIYDEEASDETILKIFHLFLNFKQDILDSNNGDLIVKYNNLMIRLSNLKEVFSVSFMKERQKEFNDLKKELLTCYEDIRLKYIELYGINATVVKRMECLFTPTRMIQFDSLLTMKDYYPRIKSKYDNKIIDIYSLANVMLKETDMNRSEEEMKLVYDLLIDDFKDNLKYYLESYRKIGKEEGKTINDFFKEFVKVPFLLYEKYKNTTYLIDMIDFLKECLKDKNELPTYQLYESFSILLDWCTEFCKDIRNRIVLEKALELFSYIYNENSSKLDFQPPYKESYYRYDYYTYTCLYINKMIQDYYLSKKDLEILKKIKFKFENKKILVEEYPEDKVSHADFAMGEITASITPVMNSITRLLYGNDGVSDSFIQNYKYLKSVEKKDEIVKIVISTWDVFLNLKVSNEIEVEKDIKGLFKKKGQKEAVQKWISILTDIRNFNHRKGYKEIAMGIDSLIKK